MNDLTLSHELLFSLLCFSFILCVFCSASETSIMALNRYRLKHLAKIEAYAQRIMKLLAHPDRLLGVILIGNTFATAIFATAANQLMESIWGDLGVLAAPLVVTFFLLVFAEVMPKTVAAIKPLETARIISWPLPFMLKLLYPLVWFATGLSTSLLRLFGLQFSGRNHDSITREELRTLVHEASGLIPSKHQSMLLSILDLEKIRVEHIMIPRNEVIGIDLNNDFDKIVDHLKTLQHTLLPIYRSDLDNVLGILHTRDILKVLSEKKLNEQALLEVIEEPYFVPESTSLHTQLLNFQQHKRRMALVVDEYGDVLGLVTLEDILEEIVGEFTTSITTVEQNIQAEEDGSFLIDGSISVRDLNRIQQWELPTEGPTTLSGLIIENLEAIPHEGTCILIAHYPIEVIKVKDNIIKLARISKRLKPAHEEPRDLP